MHVLKAARLEDQTINICDESIPTEPTPVLQPTPCRPSKIAMQDKQNIQNFITKGMQNINDFGEWLLNYITPKPKVLHKVLESFKKKCTKRRDTNTVQICFEELCDTVSNKRIKWIQPRIISS